MGVFLACFEAKMTFLVQEFYQKLRGNLNMFSIFKTFSLLTYIFPTVWTHSHGWFIVMARVLGRDCYAELFQSYFAEVSGWNWAAVWLCFRLLTPTPPSKKKEKKHRNARARYQLLEVCIARVPWPVELWHFRQAADLTQLLRLSPVITPCVMKFSRWPARKNGHPAVINLCLKVKLTLRLKESSSSRGGLGSCLLWSSRVRFLFPHPR